ncbi:agmatine/peptidylarginine deiminase [Streptomyces cyaneofuscatus]|uniref:agmatine deiminase family protein n=1 Tax=Streptomyces cyaneofuscatus TaxID=66883 RepID=UPI00369C4025
MAWPDSTAIRGRGTLAGIQADIALIARTIARYEPVVMCANSASADKARSVCGTSVTVISSIPVDDCWMRDTSPVFRTDGAGGLDAVGLNFNGWGNKQAHGKDARVAERIASYVGVPFTSADFVGEGGAIEQDGADTLMATRGSLLNRNPGMSERTLTAEMCEAYGASKVIWFDGVYGQDITDNHVDATSRFLAPGEALVQMPLATDNDAYAKDAVFCAHFGDSRADTAAKATLARLYPDRTIGQLNIDRLGTGGGDIHCVTQQQPVP